MKAISASSESSSPGQSAPAPSAPQKQPKLVSSRPTANLIVFSGTRCSGPRASTPATTTTTSATTAPTIATSSRPCALPNVITMKTTSSPSSRTPLKAIVKEYQSSPARRSLARRLGLGPLALERLVLVVQRLVAARAQDRLAQPLQPEDEQEAADEQAQVVDRDLLQRRPERGGEHGQHDRRRAHADQRRAPAAHRADAEHDRQRLDHLDRAGEEGSEADEDGGGVHAGQIGCWIGTPPAFAGASRPRSNTVTRTPKTKPPTWAKKAAPPPLSAGLEQPEVRLEQLVEEPEAEEEPGRDPDRPEDDQAEDGAVRVEDEVGAEHRRDRAARAQLRHPRVGAVAEQQRQERSGSSSPRSRRRSRRRGSEGARRRPRRSCRRPPGRACCRGCGPSCRAGTWR